MTTQPIFKSPQGEQAIKRFYQAVLDRWPVPHATQTLPTRHGDTFIIASGPPDAPPLVLLHGSSTNSATWMGDAAAYGRYFRVYAVDTPGEPGLSAPQRSSLQTAAYAEWLSDVLEGLDISQTNLIGMSLGGWLALKFAVTHPDRVRSLALIAPGGVVSMKLSSVLKIVGVSLFGRWGAARVRKMVYRDVSVPAEVNAFADLVGAHFNPRTDPLPNFTPAELQRLTMPLLLLVGEHDCFYDARKMTARMRAALPHAEVHLLRGAGHVLLNTQPTILTFLQQVARQGVV